MTLTALPPDDAVRLADLNLAAYLRHATGHADGGAIEDEDGLLLVAGAHPNPHPYVNCALRLESRLPPADVLERADEFFGRHRRGYALWIRDHADRDLEEAAREAGLWQRPPLEGQPALFIDRPLQLDESADTDLHLVEDLESAREYLRVVGDAYDLTGSPQELVWAMFLTPEAILAPEVAAFVAYADG